jgi:phage/plasmid-associated DNA primase
MQWMQQVNSIQFPLESEADLKTDRIAFRNGYFDLNTLAIHAWDDPSTDRNFKTDMYMEFDCPYEIDPLIFNGTPVWDKMISHQLHNSEDREWLEALIGRLFYKVRSKDAWQIIPWLVGDANTGKSTICNIISKFFPDDLAGSITATYEPKFGLSALCTKRVLITADTPINIHQLLSAADFQSMVSGDKVGVARKNDLAIPYYKWHAPLIFASNGPAMWADAAGSIKRRCWHFMFQNLVDNLDTNFFEIITTVELPYLFRRFIHMYHTKRAVVGSADIWKFAPPMVVSARDELCVVTDPLTEFINNGSRYFQCTYKIGAVTTLTELNSAYNKFMEHERKVDFLIIILFPSLCLLA